MQITVAICTWNRAPLLRETLEQLRALRVPEGIQWELIVVDNNSTDDTPRVIDEFASVLPIRHLHEVQAGKSHAANHALRVATGQYILWTDDDVLVDPEWMAAYVAAFRAHPAAGFFGGLIRPWFPNDPPEWLRRGFPHVASAFAALDLGPDARQLRADSALPYGANLAFRTADQRAYLFDVTLGPRPQSEIRGEEIDVLRRMCAAGIEGWWVPDAAVRHYIPVGRQSLRYIAAYYRGQGEYEGRFAPPPNRTLFGVPLWVLRDAAATQLSYRWARVFGNTDEWMPRLRGASIAWGKISGSRGR